MKTKFAVSCFCVWLIIAISFNDSAAVSISVTPTTNMVLPGSVRSVYSNVQGDLNVAVSWATNGGSLQSFAGYAVWTAPATPGTYTVTATSVVDGMQSASSIFTVISNSVVKTSNIPAQATIFKGQPIGIQSILWGSTNTAVTWSSSGGTLAGTGREVLFSANVAGTYTITSTSAADNTKTATTTIVVTNNPWPGVSTANKTMPIDCTATGSGSTYEVTDETRMDAVPWATLGAGDTVRIHSGVYHKQILISTSGTETQPIRVCGVADANGNLPELNGANATAKTGSNYGAAPYGLQTYGGIIIYSPTASYFGGESYPKNIIIEGIKITGFHPTNKCYDLSVGGTLANYVNGAAPVRIQHGKNITIRGNDFQNSGNGFFVMSNNSVESKTTRNLLVEGNYFYDNGVTTYEHQSYIQAFGLVVQGNYYDNAKIGVLGSQLKTRSVQQFIRYNYFEPAGRVFDLVEIQDSPDMVFPWVGVQASESVNTSTNDVVANYEAYQNRYVYGNIIHNVSNNTATYKTSSSIIHVSADNDQTYQPGGTVYFYNNTIWDSLITAETSNYRTYIVDAGPYGTAINTHTIYPIAQLANNAVYIAQSIPSSGRVFSWNRYQPDRVILEKNWVSNGWGTGGLAGGDGTGISASPGDNSAAVWQGGSLATQVSGISNLITGATIPFDANSYVPQISSPLLNASVPLTGLATLLPPLMQYSPMTHLMSVRVDINDIGAIGVDRIQPVVAVTSAFSPIKSSSATLSGTVSDNIGVASVTAKLVGSLQIIPAIISGNNWSVTVSGLVEDDNIINVTATDTSGNIKTIPATIDVDMIPPIINTFTIPVTSSSLTVSGVNLTATDNNGVTGFLITETSTAPTSETDGWTTAAPTSFTFSVAGGLTAYAWAKDGAGNVSTRASAPVTITSPLTNPTISDALKTLKGARNITSLNASERFLYDVAPLGSNSGTPLGNGVVNEADVILILRRSIGIGSW